MSVNQGRRDERKQDVPHRSWADRKYALKRGTRPSLIQQRVPILVVTQTLLLT